MDFLIGNKAEDLYFKVFDITTNKKHIPVKFRRFADKIQDSSIQLYCDIVEANNLRIDMSTQKQKRFDLQTNAISNCDKIESLIKYAKHANLVSSAVCEEWINLVNEIRKMLYTWRKF